MIGEIIAYVSAKKRCFSGTKAFSKAGGWRGEGGRRSALMTLGKRKRWEGQTGPCKTPVWRDPLEAPLALLKE